MDGIAEHALDMIFIELFKLRQYPVYPIGLLPEEGASETWFNMTTVHCCKDSCVVFRRRVVVGGPC